MSLAQVVAAARQYGQWLPDRIMRGDRFTLRLGDITFRTAAYVASRPESAIVDRFTAEIAKFLAQEPSGFQRTGFTEYTLPASL